MTKIKNDFNESFSFNLVFLIENHFWEDQGDISPWELTLNFENAIFLLAHFKILVIVGKKINIQGWSVLKGGPSDECAKKTDNLKSTLLFILKITTTELIFTLLFALWDFKHMRPLIEENAVKIHH